MANLYQIKLQGTADTTAWVQAQGVLKGLTNEANQFVDTLKAGVGIDLGGKLVNSIAAIPNLFKSILERGVAFDKNLGDSEIGIANVLAKFQNLDAAAAKQEAAKAIAKIIELEPKSAATLQGLTQGFLATVAPAQAAGVSVEQNIDLVGKFANALANANIPAEQLSQELRAIFTGNITPDAALAKILNINNDDIEKAKQAGQLYDFLNKQLGSLGEAGDTAGVAFSTLESAIDKAAGELAKPLFKLLVQGAKDLAVALEDPAIIESIQQVGLSVGKLANTGLELTKWALANAEALLRVARGAVVLGEALAGLKLASIIVGLGRMAVQLSRTPLLLSAETAALSANTAAQTSNAAAREISAGVTAAGTSAGNAAAAAGASTGAKFAGGFGANASRLAGQVVNNLGLIIAAGIAGWEIGKWIGDELLVGTDEAIEKASKKSGIIELKTKVKLKLEQGDREGAAKDVSDEVKRIVSELNAERKEGVAIQNSLNLVNKDQRVQANKNLITQLELDLVKTVQLESQITAALSPQQAASNAADVAARKQAALNEQLRVFSEEGGDLQAKVEGLRAAYDKLATASSNLTGKNLNVAPGDLTGVLKDQIGSDTLDSKNADAIKKSIQDQIKAGQELIKAETELAAQKRQHADEIKRAQDDQIAAATARLELEERIARAVGNTAEAERLKAELEKQKLAESLLNSGAAKQMAEARAMAGRALDAEAAQTKKIADEKLAKTREEAALETKILEARAAGNEKGADAVEDQLKAMRLAAQLQDSLKLSATEALAEAQKRVSLERAAEDRGKRSSLDDKFDASVVQAQQKRSQTFRGLAGFEELQSRTTRSTFKFPALDAFEALQNDPRRRAPVSSVSDRVISPQGVRPGANGVRPGGGVEGATNALNAAGLTTEQKLAQVTTSIERISLLLVDRANGANSNYQRMIDALRKVESGLKQEIADVRSSVKSNRA